MTKRIAITGLGVLSPVGIGHEQFWANVTAGTVGTGPIQSFDTSMFDFHNGGEVKGFEPSPYFHHLNPDLCGRTTQLAVAASRQAVDHADLIQAGYDADRIGVCMGTTMGNQSVVEDENDRRVRQDIPIQRELAGHYPESFISAAISR